MAQNVWRKPWARLAGFGATFLVCVSLVQLAIRLNPEWHPEVRTRQRPLTDRTFAWTAERLDRGRYLVEGVLHCFECHTNVDTSDDDGAFEAGKGAGRILNDWGDFRIVAPNITPDPETGAGQWSDDMLARAIREGIGHEGRALYPAMPYRSYRNLSDEDLGAVIVYLRSIPPIRNTLPRTALTEKLGRIAEQGPSPIMGRVPAPDLSDPIRRGRYFVMLGNCSWCHTGTKQKGFPYAGEFAGGRVHVGTSGEVASSNLTPDRTGIGHYDEAAFMDAMRTGRVGTRTLDPIMPWRYFRNLSDSDLAAVFAYLRRVTPASHIIDNSQPPTACKRCGNSHGSGDRNE